MTPSSICVIGAGPRGTAVVERLLANAGEFAPGTRLDIHVLDPFPPGGGHVWQARQPGVLLMNTLGGHATAFLDGSVRCAGPVVPGPTLFEWAKSEVPQGDYPEAVAAEAEALRPWDFPTRALQGHYLTWVFDRLAATTPPGVSLVVHRARALELRAEGGRWLVGTDRGESLAVDAVVLATGHTGIEPSRSERELLRFAERHGRFYAPPANPLDLALDRIAPGETVLARGLGLNFFDCLSLLTEGRGGRFERMGGRLRYRPSGREPVIFAGSRTGIPYRARGRMLDRMPAGRPPRYFTDEVVAALRTRRGTVDFVRDVWPLVAKDAAAAYYATLLAEHACAIDVPEFWRLFDAASWGTAELDSVLCKAFPDPVDRLDLERLTDPLAGTELPDRDALTACVVGHLRADLAAALDPERSPVKAAAVALGAARSRIRDLVTHGGLRGGSYRDHLDGWFRGMAASLASGPPAIRQEQLLALVGSGIVGFVGPRMRVETEETAGLFLGDSPVVGGPPVRATALIEARLPGADLRRTTEPLLRDLRDGGLCRPYALADPEEPDHETGGIEVTEDFRVVDAAGHPHRALFAFGIPIEAVHWGTAIGARAGGNAVLFRQADAIARAALDGAV